MGLRRGDQCSPVVGHRRAAGAGLTASAGLAGSVRVREVTVTPPCGLGPWEDGLAWGLRSQVTLPSPPGTQDSEGHHNTGPPDLFEVHGEDASWTRDRSWSGCGRGALDVLSRMGWGLCLPSNCTHGVGCRGDQRPHHQRSE